MANPNRRNNRRSNRPSRNNNRRNNRTNRDNQENKTGRVSKSTEKKAVFTVAYLFYNFIPYFELDLFRLPIINQLGWLIGKPAGFLGDKIYDIATKIPVIGYLFYPVTGSFWFLEPLGKVEMIGKEFLLEKGILKGIERLGVMYGDNIAEFVAGIATAGIGGAVINIVAFFMDTSFWKMLEQYGLDRKIKHSFPHVGAWLISIFLFEKYRTEENESELSSTKSKNRPMTDGGEDQNRYNEYQGKNNSSGMNSGNVSGNSSANNWKDIQNTDQSSSSVDLSKLPASPAKIFGSIAVIGILGLLGFSLIGSGGVFGVAADYTGANFDTPDIADTVSYSVSKAGKTVSCLGNEGCVREWQLNSTRRPGSEDVGETYELNIRNFQVFGSGNGVDVAYNRRDSSIPVYFLVQNSRNGLKGIDARNVEYKVKVRDDGLLNGQNYCQTDWISLDEGYSDGTLLPGEAAEPTGWQNELTLEECGMLQPSAGNYLNFILEVKYDYSSKSTLYVDAMSREHRRSQQIPINFKNSETADTPVETYIETRQPVMFNENGDSRSAIPFTTRVGVVTDEENIGYKIDQENFVFEASSLTEEVEGSCRGLENSEGNSYKLSDQAKNQISNRQENSFFDNRKKPSSASCTLKLAEDELNSISRTGETLTMSADVNYTIKLEKRKESFKLFNSRCSTNNCPQLIPLSGENLTESVIRTDLETTNPEENPGEYWSRQYATCNGPDDSQSGCDVVAGFNPDERANKLGSVDDGEVAINMGEVGSVGQNFVTCHVQNELNLNSDNRIAGIKENELETALGRNNAINYTENSWEVVGLGSRHPTPDSGCTSTSSENDGSSDETSDESSLF